MQCCLALCSTSEQPDPPGRASARVGIGNRAEWFLGRDHGLLQQAISTLDAPLGRGAVSRRRVTVQILEQATSQSLGSPAAHTSILSKRLSLWDYTKLLYEPFCGRNLHNYAGRRWPGNLSSRLLAHTIPMQIPPAES